MSPTSMLFTSREARWFLEGSRLDHPALVDRFRSAAAFTLREDVPAPAWRGRQDEKPDVYLLIPGAEDMGVKWREGLLQIKGRTRLLPGIRFGALTGDVECWAKWSYAGLPPAWSALFSTGEPADSIERVTVDKERMLRLVEIAADGEAAEVDPASSVDRGFAVELTEVRVADRRFLSLGFEAYPDDEPVADCFHELVSRFVAELDEAMLSAARSLSYPGWLAVELA